MLKVKVFNRYKTTQWIFKSHLAYFQIKTVLTNKLNKNWTICFYSYTHNPEIMLVFFVNLLEFTWFHFTLFPPTTYINIQFHHTPHI